MEQYKRIVDDRWSYKIACTKEYTHGYHVYPAMMIPQIARAIIDEFYPKDKCELLFDPYCGSGTSLVEASLKGINSIGIDLNPLARLIAKVKTTRYNVEDINRLFFDIQSQLMFYSEALVLNTNFDRISNYTYWYSKENLLKLSFLSQLIDKCGDYIDFFNVALSEVVREVSFTRNGEFKRFRMKEEKIKSFRPNVFRLFEEKVLRNIGGLLEYNKAARSCRTKVYGYNSSVAIPNEIIESAKVDGASEYKIFASMIIPLSKPVIATIGLIVFLAKWNDWNTSLIYIQDPKLYSLQYLLQKILKEKLVNITKG